MSAVRFTPTAVQDSLRVVNVAGTDHQVRPTEDDFYRRVINIRREVKAELSRARASSQSNVDIDRLDSKQLALKILANATSYGVLYRVKRGGWRRKRG